jgi:hypothetical protein
MVVTMRILDNTWLHCLGTMQIVGTTAHGTHKYRCALNEWPLTTAAAVTLNTCYSRHQKKNETRFYISLCQCHSEAYRILMQFNVCISGGCVWWRGRGEIVGSGREQPKIILYYSEEGENKVILLSWCCFLLSRGMQCNQKIGCKFRSKAMRNIGISNLSQLFALSVSCRCGLRTYMKWNNDIFSNFFETRISVHCTVGVAQAVWSLGHELSDRG